MINLVLKKGSDYAAFKALLAQRGYTFKQFGTGRIFSVETDLDSFELIGHENIEAVTQDKEIGISPQYSTRTLPTTNHRPTETPNADSWALARICRRSNPYFNPVDGYAASPVSTEYAWSRTGAGVDCYVIDEGMYPSHPAFTGRVTWVSDGSTTREATDSDHGTATTSCMAGVGVGVATDALIWYVQSPAGAVTEAMFVTQYDEVYQHYISRAHTNRPAVLNHSFAGVGYTVDSPAAEAMVADLIEAGVVICIAAGNLSDNADEAYVKPGEYDPDTLTIGSCSAVDAIMEYTSTVTGYRISSTTGQAVDLYAPGVGVSCAYRTDGYIQYNGTSFASPYTAGVVACMLQGYQRLTHREQVKSVNRRLIHHTTKDKLRYNPNGKGVVHNRILYIDPTVTFEEIPGLEPI